MQGAFAYMKHADTYKLRNKLTHEYPNNEDDVIEAQTQFTQLLNQTVFIVDKVICWIMNIFT